MLVPAADKAKEHAMNKVRWGRILKGVMLSVPVVVWVVECVEGKQGGEKLLSFTEKDRLKGLRRLRTHMAARMES